MIVLKINGINKSVVSQNSETLFTVLRRNNYFGIKFGDEQGLSGSDTVLIDGKPVNSSKILAGQAVGHDIVTIEGLGENPDLGWKPSKGLHPLQRAFIETGAIQCGYCTPAQILAAKSLLEKNINPSEDEVREAISGVLCRCTGYEKPVRAILSAAKELRQGQVDQSRLEDTTPDIISTFQKREFDTVGKSEIKLDAVKLVQGKTAFSADYTPADALFAKVLHSPVAHARIKSIDASKAKELPGVACVLTWQDIPRVVYSTAGQSDPIPGPLDTFSLDYKVRFVGDRVAMVAATSPEIAERALSLLHVEYEELPAIIDVRDAMKPGAVIIHDEPEFVDFADSDPKKNLAAEIRIDIGDVEKGFAQADQIFEHEYTVSKVQQAHIEPHVCLTYWDEDDRLVVKTSTQVPFHLRRVLAPVIGLPIKRIRVIKPRVGGGFGGKQEILIEDVAAHLTIATGKPVLYEYSREEEFIAARSRHPMRIRMKTGVKKDGTITANEMYALSDTGANGAHALTVTGNTGHKSLALYVGDGEFRKNPNIRFYADIVYTNTPPTGAFRGYGVPQGYFPLDRHLDFIAREMGFDPIQFRLKNTIREGEYHPFSTAWNEGREPRPEIIHTVGLSECIKQGKAATKWDEKFNNPNWQKVEANPDLRRGIGVATVMQGTGIPYLDMGGAMIKLNDDGSFNLQVGATDLGTGSDTVLSQMAAEVLGVKTDDIICYSSDTDFTPFDVGAYASSTTYISGAAVIKAAEQAAEQIKTRAALILNQRQPELNLTAKSITLRDRKAFASPTTSVSMEEIALNSLHHQDQQQIMGTGSYFSPSSPPPFAAQFAEVTVDTKTGEYSVDSLCMVVDGGVIVNPQTASGQVEGGMIQALGYAVCENMTYTEKGEQHQKDFRDYHIYFANEIPQLTTIFVETNEPSHPFGVKAVAEIPMDGVAPAVGNAILNATGAHIDSLPISPEKIWKALNS